MSEKFGAGKTIIILALTLAKPIPDNRPIYQTCRVNPYQLRNHGCSGQKTSFFIKKVFDDDHIIKPALLFVASSVLLQWKKAVKDFTDLKIFVVAGVYDLRDLYKRMRNKSINNYDIVLVKNGNITGKFTVHGYYEDKNDRMQRKIYNVIANISRGLCWSRVIFDDYDIIKLPRPTGFINGLFTWFISATDLVVRPLVHEHVEHDNLCDILKYHNINLYHMSRSPLLKEVFNVCNDEKYTEESISSGRPVFWAHTIVNKNKQYIQMIGAMAGDKAYRIMEMLNGDAIETAAEHAGIKTNNITDILKRSFRTNMIRTH